MSEIKKVKIGSTQYDIAAKYLLDSNGNLKDWDAITALIEAGADIVVLQTLPTANELAYNTYKGDMIFAPDASALSGSYIEYIIMRTGTAGSYSYSWEPIGSTTVDLSNYLQYGVTYNAAALANGDHSHSVTVPKINVDKTQKLGATASGTAVGASGTDTFIKSYPGVKRKLVTTSIAGVSGSTTASKATAGTSFSAVKTVTISENSEDATGRITYVKSVSAVTLGGQKAVPTNAIKSASLTGTAVSSGTATFALVPSVDSDGVLTFTSGTASVTTAAADTANVTVSGGSATTRYLGTSTTTGTVTPYTFENVTVPIAASAKTVATGSVSSEGTGDDVMTGLGTPTSATAVTGVSVTAQPTITITENTTNTGPVIEHTTTGAVIVSTNTAGSHTHDVQVND